MVSFVISILSLRALLDSAFLVPTTCWEDRLTASLARTISTTCVSLISGLLFHFSQQDVPLARTLPVRLFLWALSGLSLLFVLGWYLDVSYMLLFWRNLPH